MENVNISFCAEPMVFGFWVSNAKERIVAAVKTAP
jgi:hypothetical protein